MKYNLSVLPVLMVIGLALTISSCNTPEKKAAYLMNEGAQLVQQGKYNDAIRKYQEGILIDPNNAVAYNLLGMAYRFRFNQSGAQEFKDKEIEAFRKAISVDPKFWTAYKNLSASLYYQGRKKDAVPYLERSLELQPNDPEKQLLLQWIEEGKQQ
jgi:tetratricopeptide (TPR) repeat protein